MIYNPELHHRRSIRLKGYDYSQSGIYFVTICTKDKEHTFGIIKNGEIALNKYGNIVKNEWMKTPKIRKEIELHRFIVMPNHIHGIVEIIDGRGDRPVAPTGKPFTPPMAIPAIKEPGPKHKTIGSMVAGYKSTVTKQINILRNIPFAPVWQRNYYEHIIRNEESYYRISEFIKSNPMNWPDDIYN